jgi:murein DD-endopeptidase MepM/ murein hydrolase activator NlpD
MSARDSFPKAQLPSSHIFITLAQGSAMRTFALRPLLIYGLAGLGALAVVWLSAASAFVVFHADLVNALVRRQAEMQYAYEDRLAALRVQIDRITSHQLLDQDSFEGQMNQLISRQAQLENRAALIVQLADRATARTETPAALAGGGEPRVTRTTHGKSVPNPLVSIEPQADGPASVSGFAPLESRAEPHLPAAKPRPEGSETNQGFEETIGPARQRPTSPTGAASRDPHMSAADPLALGARLQMVDGALKAVEGTQLEALGAIEARTHRQVSRLQRVLAETGLSADRLVPPPPRPGEASGGPFVPFKIDPARSTFEAELAALQSSVLAADRLNRIVSATPLARPLSQRSEVTSVFGGRTDPFNGRMAMHTGVDFRGEYGAAVRATAPGRVVSAGTSGGYGKMVEIDHGNGLSTRYAHLSAINVEEGQWVPSGAIVGELGSTGRSTGPHLHYETRIDGEAVDPQRFLRAGARLDTAD